MQVVFQTQDHQLKAQIISGEKNKRIRRMDGTTLKQTVYSLTWQAPSKYLSNK